MTERPPLSSETPRPQGRPLLPGLALLLLIAGIAGSFLVFGYYVYPVPSGDSQSFLPTALTLDAGLGLRNPVSRFSRDLDPTGQGRYVQYPPLFPWSVALLMPAPTPRAAFLAVALLSVLDLVLAAWLFWRAAGISGRRAASAVWAVAAATLGIATLLLGQQNGRPEPLATLWVLLAAHALLTLRPALSWLPCGVLLGLTGATHPMAGVILGLLLATFLSVRLPVSAALQTIGSLLALSLLVFSAVLALSPPGLGETLDGIRRHADLTIVERHSGERLSTYWITHPGATFYALPFLLLLPAGWQGLRAWRSAVRSPLLCGLCLVVLAVVVWGSSGRSPEHVYNLHLFAPLVFAANLGWAGTSARPSTRALVPAVHALTALGYLRAVVLFGFFLPHGVSLETARADFARIAPLARGPVSVTPSLWVLSDDLERLRTVPAHTPAESLEGDLLILQQNYSGLSTPPDLPGLRLIENHFVDRPCRLFGLPVARTMPGYGFAAYRRES